MMMKTIYKRAAMMTRLLRCKDSGSEDDVSWKLELLLEMMVEV